MLRTPSLPLTPRHPGRHTFAPSAALSNRQLPLLHVLPATLQDRPHQARLRARSPYTPTPTLTTEFAKYDTHTPPEGGSARDTDAGHTPHTLPAAPSEQPPPREVTQAPHGPQRPVPATNPEPLQGKPFSRRQPQLEHGTCGPALHYVRWRTYLPYLTEDVAKESLPQ
jgi:hypothetical protein